MLQKFVFVLLGSLSLAAGAADVFRWTDERGKVHYGESVPERYKATSRKVDAANPGVPFDRRSEAEARLAREKEAAESIRKAREARSEAPKAKPGAAEEKRAASEPSCDEQMQRYQESIRCFAPYVNANGSVRAEAFEKCPQVKQPVSCATSPGSSERR